MIDPIHKKCCCLLLSREHVDRLVVTHNGYTIFCTAYLNLCLQVNRYAVNQVLCFVVKSAKLKRRNSCSITYSDTLVMTISLVLL